MSLHLSRLEKVRERNGKTIARCPACAESGGDRKGVHLFIMADGKFGCVANPGEGGKSHRQRIFALVGDIGPLATGTRGIRIRRPPEAASIIPKGGKM